MGSYCAVVALAWVREIVWVQASQAAPGPMRPQAALCVASFAVVLCAMMVAMCAYWWKQVKRLTSVAWEGHCVEHVEWRLSHVDGGDVPMLRGKKCTSAVVGEF